MKLVSRQVDYAVNALCFMAERGSFASVSDLQKGLDMPRSFMRGIMRFLCKAGVLRSTRGRGGGFTLALPPEKINVFGLMAVFDEAGADENCTFKKRACPQKRNCSLRPELLAVEETIRKRMKAITIASLICPQPRLSERSGQRCRRVGGPGHD